MGKPSRTRLSKEQSQQSLSSKSTKSSQSKKENKMGWKNKKASKQNKIHKTTDKLREHKSTQNKIEKLKKVFDDLRNQSTQNLESACENTVIVLDDDSAFNETLINNNKRKLSESNITESNTKCLKLSEEDNPVLIPDEDDVLIVNSTPRKNLNSAPIDCSTPLANATDNNENKDDIGNFNNDVENLTREINRDSYLTIDLTTESNLIKQDFNTVIDLDSTNENQDCTFVSTSNCSLSISGESNGLHNPRSKKFSGKRMNSFVNRISKMDASEKGKLLELITENIFNGCKVPNKIKKNISMLKGQVDRTTETAEDSYIKEVMLGERQSRNSIGSNIYNPQKDENNKSGLRMIIIDGSNVAMEHGKGRVFSVKGLKICIDYFLRRGHVVKAFVPRFRCKFGMSSEPRLLDDLERSGLVVYTPSREIQGRKIASYDDRYIVQCAAEFDGVIVSGDNYRDLHRENPRWRFVIENRVLPFTWVNDMIMFPKDPLGRNGPSLETLLKHPPVTEPKFGTLN